jgi:hypothetical protein
MRAAVVAMILLASLPAAADYSPTLGRGVKLYDRKDFYNATIDLEKVLQHDSGDDAAGVQMAEYFMAKALYQMGYSAASLALVDKIVHTDGHKYRINALKWGVALGQSLGDDRVAYLVGAYNAHDLDDPSLSPVRGSLHYLLGIGLLAHGEAAGAVAELSLVPPGDFDRDRALVVLGFVHAQRGAPDQAAAAWAGVQAGPGDAVDLAALATGELHLRAGAWDDARAAFAGVRATSGLAARAAWEASWATLREHGVAAGLDELFAPTTTGVSGRAAMDVPWLLTLEVCGAASSSATADVLAAFHDDHVAMQRALGELLDRHPDRDELFERVVVPVRARTATFGTRRLRDYLTVLFTAPPMTAAMAWDDELAHELAQLGAADKAWQTTAVASELLQMLTVAKSVADGEAGKLARERIAHARDSIAALLQVSVKLPAGRDGGLAVTCR